MAHCVGDRLSIQLVFTEDDCFSFAMSFFELLENHFPGRVKRPASIAELPSDAYMVYVLTIDESAIVIGHGRRDRARVIFDSLEVITPSHIKALLVRIYIIHGRVGASVGRYIIVNASKEEAKVIENKLHSLFGGNTTTLPEGMLKELLAKCRAGSLSSMVMRMALCSTFDGITDLKKWRRNGLIPDELWSEITEMLKLPQGVGGRYRSTPDDLSEYENF